MLICKEVRVGRVAQSVARLTQVPGVLDWLSSPVTVVKIDSSPTADSRKVVVSFWQKYVVLVLNHLGGLGLRRNSVVRLTGRPDMAIAVYRGRKATTQQWHGVSR